MEKVIIIAEAGVNHNGDLDIALKLIDAAAEAGVDYVKFQTFKAEKLVSRFAEKAEYQIQNTQNSTENQLEMLRKLELSYEHHDVLIDYCEKVSVKFLSTAFDLESMNFLKSIGINLLKIPSGEITNYPYLQLASRLFDKIILSTGMSSINDIQNALAVLNEGSSKEITLLHCNTEYPTPMSDVNLLAMQHLRDTFSLPVGYSDHTLGIEVPIAAVGLGATVIEKHFTLDKNLPGPDHAASLEPHELKAMVSGIRNIELAISGSGIKEPSASEKKNIAIARKSIIAAIDIKKGEIFTEKNLTTKRPGNGISAMRWNEVIGTVAIKDFLQDGLIEL